ncbi:hypothetical protein LLE49_26495 [Alicyclobacillus tolerans]|uniref:hypothetical protein n=1 Tax=Alicyclobacillus tolerans TaxID=90970 RepID=UPI001F2D6D5F|nr:hypothetical protein [Alicyclobacillus tolerans]MCF8568277.1 hypothetical protein [Alicyclobacillus tolerans]
MKRRWLTYISIGILFGILDFYFPSHATIWLFAVWLVPIVPIILYQAKVSHSKKLSALASGLTWFIAVVFYYLTNVFQLATGSSYEPWMSISNYKSPHFWSNWKSTLLSYVLGHIIEWGIIGVIGGSIIGFLVSFIFLFFSRKEVVK